MSPKRVLIVGGVAGGASCATRLRRLDEHAEIVVFEKGPHPSFANCGLPYYVGDTTRMRQSCLWPLQNYSAIVSTSSSRRKGCSVADGRRLVILPSARQA